MEIKLLFQILTPLSMGGSVIGLFGDFGVLALGNFQVVWGLR